MIDRDGFRPNVAIVLVNHRNQVFWGKRIKEHAWQFPQGGIKPGESPEQAMYRELEEETGLKPAHVEILGPLEHLHEEDEEVHRLALEAHGPRRAAQLVGRKIQLELAEPVGRAG